VIDWLLEPLGYAFFLRALVASVAVGIVCAAVGSFVVLRGMAFFGDALAHAVLPGVALGYLLGGGGATGIFLGALGAALASALVIGQLARRGGLKQDTAIGIVFAGMFALGIVLISTRRGFAVDLTHILFGNVLGVGRGDLWLIVGLGLLVLVVLAALYKEFVLISFDSVQATTLRLPVHRLEALLLTLMALTIVVALETVGVALLVAMLVTPASTGYLLARRLPGMIAIGAAVGALSGAVGIYASYHLSRQAGISIASGAAIVLVSTLLFGAAALWARGPGARG
jgi:ABC-type Mn2+/Zn2+ transport system permease subunit